jgi:hypothetical protein
MGAYVTQQWEWDAWNSGALLTVGGAVASGIAALMSDDSEAKGLFSVAGTVLGVAGAFVGAAMPPRCPACLIRSVPQGGAWVCPSGHGVVRWT